MVILSLWNVLRERNAGQNRNEKSSRQHIKKYREYGIEKQHEECDGLWALCLVFSRATGMVGYGEKQSALE